MAKNDAADKMENADLSGKSGHNNHREIFIVVMSNYTLKTVTEQ